MPGLGLDEKVKQKAMQKLEELKSILGDVPVSDFIANYESDEEPMEEEMDEPAPEKEPMGKSDPAKIALIVARLKKKA